MPTMRVYTTEEKEAGAGRVPELRPSKRGIPQWARILAVLIGAGGGAGIGSSMTVSVVAGRLGLVAKKDLDDRFAADKLLRDARDTVVDGKFTALDARLAEMTKANQAQAQATQTLTRIVRKLRPAAKDAP